MSEDTVKYKGVVITKEDRQFSKIINGDSFTVQVPTSYEKRVLIQTISNSIGGVNINSIPQMDYIYVEMIATLTIAIVKWPDWWEGADKCPDENLLGELWRFYLSAADLFADRLKKKSKTKAVEKSKKSS